MGKISVLIVDDHAVVRQGLRNFLEIQDDVEIVGEAENGLDALEKVRLCHPDIVLMDLVMPKMDGIEATRQINAANSSTKIIVLTSFSENDQVFSAIKAGATGYLLKDVSPTDLVGAIRATYQGESQLHPDIVNKLMQEFASQPVESQRTHGNMTERELEVLGLIARGMSNREIAHTLTISEKTVKAHVGNILSKLHLKDRTQAAIYAHQNGLVPGTG
jgi:two-component system, NarL family, response regulator LiaR